MVQRASGDPVYVRKKMLSATCPFHGGSATVLTRSEVLDGPPCEDALGRHCKDFRYYQVVEETLANDFQYYYLVLRDSAGVTRGVQPFLLARQNLLEGIPGSVRKLIDSLRRKYPTLLTTRILMVGCAAGEGNLGNINAADEAWVADALHACLPSIARQMKASLVVLKDFSAKYRPALTRISQNGFTRVPSMPMTELELHFRDFEDYLNHLSYSTRKSLRRKLRRTERATKIELEVVNQVDGEADELYPLYLAVHQRSPMKFERLTPEYLRQLGRRMPERVRFFIWRIGGKVVAFSVCLVHDGILYDEYLGLDYSVALDLHLYFYTIRDILSWAIANGLKYYRSSPLNYDPKLHLGCQLVPLDLYVRHTAPFLNPLFRYVIRFLEPTRHDPVLQKFSNATDLW